MILLTILGLALFEIISSIDNAVINAEVLETLQAPSRRWFSTWGFLLAVIVVRGLLPWGVVWATVPSLGPIGALTASFQGQAEVSTAIEHAAPFLLMCGGIFLVFLFLYWLFLEEKHFGLPTEPFFARRGVWFYATASLILLYVVHRALPLDKTLALAAVGGSTLFFILHGVKENAEQQEKQFGKAEISDRSKLLYLEVIDAVFSVDGVLGAFAFTLSVPLILLGNGLGALVVRQLTLKKSKSIGQYLYLKNGAMYAIFFLGVIMLLDAFGLTVPEFVSPTITFLSVAYFFWQSQRAKA